jgi:hypothetical protein
MEELQRGKGLELEGGEIATFDGLAGLVKKRLSGEPLPAVPKASPADETLKLHRARRIELVSKAQQPANLLTEQKLGAGGGT